MTNLDSSDHEPSLVAALYKFVDLSDLENLQKSLQDVCVQNGVMGTLLLASEGINGTISGPESGIHNVLKWLKSKNEFSNLDVKFSHASKPPFLRMKVRLKKEIVTLGVDSVDAANNAGTYVPAEEWNNLISDPNVILVDTRNNYEVAIGTFKGAQNPETTSFRELPDWVDEKLDADTDAKIAMFCTGGIRCEKSTALLKAKGYKNIFHLQGGILKYLENVPEDESLWEGECFVFDQRVSVKHGLEEGQYDLCHACRMPISDDDMKSAQYEKGISCPHCFDTVDEKKRQRFADRQRQIDLASERNAKHLAADVAQARELKKEERRLQRERSRRGEKQAQ